MMLYTNGLPEINKAPFERLKKAVDEMNHPDRLRLHNKIQVWYIIAKMDNTPEQSELIALEKLMNYDKGTENRGDRKKTK